MASKRVLVVDDEECFREWTEHVLANAGYEPATAVDGVDALSKYNSARSSAQPFELLITDLVMPGMSGAELIGKVVETEPFLTLIVVSGKQDAGSVRETLYAGSWEFLQKPCKKDELLAVVKRAFEKAAILQAEAHKYTVMNSLINVERQQSQGRR